MSRDTCRLPSCDREPGEQDRDDYRSRSFCSVQCETKYEHARADPAAVAGKEGSDDAE